MKRPTIFRTVVLLAGVCTAFWQAPRIVELIDKVRGGMSPASALAGLSGRGQPAPSNDISLDELRSALSGAAAGTVGAKPSGEVIVFSPNGAALTEAQRQALIQKAHRLRPSGSGVAPDRISLPPGASPAPRPPVGADDEDEQADNPPSEGDDTSDRPTKDPGDADAPKTSFDSDESFDDLESLSTSAIGGEPVGIHDELRELLDEIAPPNHDGAYRPRRASRIAWRSASLPRGPRPAFIIGPPGSGADRIAP